MPKICLLLLLLVITSSFFFFTGCTNTCKQADKLIRQGQCDKAIELLEKYVETNKDDPTGWMLLGDAYIKKAIMIGGYGYNPATREIAMTGVNYYKKAKKIKPSRLIDNKLAIASGMLEAP